MSIQIDNLFYTYLPHTKQETKALNGISLSIDDNSFVAFVGQTGSGKSTLMQNLNALLIPTDGKVSVDDFTILNKRRKNKKIKELRKHVGLVFQFPEYQLFEDTVEKDVAFGLKNFGVKNDEAINKAHETLQSLGLDESFFKRSPLELSGGEKRKVAMAGILALEPKVLVLDEPTAGLDPQASLELMSLLTRLHDNGTAIIIVTHDMDIVMRYAEKVFVLEHGKLAFSGTPNELFSNLELSQSLGIPNLYLLANKLVNKGFRIDLSNLKTIDDIILQIKENQKHE